MRSTIFFIFALMSAAAVAMAAGNVITIMHKTTSVRADKQFFAPTVATARYGDQLPVSEEKDGWYKVSVAGKTGWVHNSAAAKGAVAVTARNFKKGAVSGQDMALAGKGFNEQVESKYRKDNPDMNFNAVDRMEKINVSDSQLSQFIAQGKLKSREAM